MPEILEIDTLFRSMSKLGASDIHLKYGMPPTVRIKTDLRPLNAPPLTDDDLKRMARSMINEEQHKRFESALNLDFAYELSETERFRVAIFYQRNHTGIVARRVNNYIPDFAALHLPPVINGICDVQQGLILVTGVTGSGKSTTIASMIQQIIKTRRCNIVTVEDPIEYIFTDDKAIVSQREVGIDVHDFHTALRHVVRQDPDVIVIGECRDEETLQAGLTAAETGHLVFTTLHSANVAQTMSRILEFFPQEREVQIRRQLQFNLRAIISQKILPSIAPGVAMVPAIEIMLNTPMVRQLITDGRDREIPEAIAADPDTGMQDFNLSLLWLVKENLADRRVCLRYTDNPEALKRLLAGITTKGGIVG